MKIVSYGGAVKDHLDNAKFLLRKGRPMDDLESGKTKL